MRYLLNLVYFALLLALSPWILAAAVRKGKYRSGFAAKFLGLNAVRRDERRKRCVWLHAVSVGEVNLLEPVIEELTRRHGDWQCVVSTTTATGYALARQKYSGHSVFYCPLDFSWAVDAAMRRIRPDVLVLAELELWPNLICAAGRHGAKVAVINGRLSESSYRGYRRIGPVVRRILSRVDLVAVQNDRYAGRFAELGTPDGRLSVTGSIKFDGAETDRDNPATQHLAELARIGADDLVLLAGSTQEPEEELALAAYRKWAAKHPRLRLILVPRHPDRFGAVATMLDRSGIGWQRRSELERAGPDRDSRVLLVDAVGELGAWWGTAAFGFVGGSMGARGGQNMIEPAAYAVAVSFGPNTHNFRDVVSAMLEADAACVVQNGDQLAEFVGRCLTQPDWARGLGRRAQDLVAGQLGATGRTVDLIDGLLGEHREGIAPLSGTRSVRSQCQLAAGVRLE